MIDFFAIFPILRIEGQWDFKTWLLFIANLNFADIEIFKSKIFEGGTRMKKQLLLLSSLCLLLSACANDNKASINADNTGRNVRDRSDQALTSGNQSESEADRTITQKIRQAIMDDNSLSNNAKNIKIMTINGVVTLRGPVENNREKTEIGKKARAVTGVKNVENQLETVHHEETSDR